MDLHGTHTSLRGVNNNSIRGRRDGGKEGSKREQLHCYAVRRGVRRVGEGTDSVGIGRYAVFIYFNTFAKFPRPLTPHRETVTRAAVDGIYFEDFGTVRTDPGPRALARSSFRPLSSLGRGPTRRACTLQHMHTPHLILRIELGLS